MEDEFTYIRDGSAVYCVDNTTGTKRIVGWDVVPNPSQMPDTPEGIYHEMVEENLWAMIRQLAKTNAALRSELDRVVTLYYLIRDQDKDDTVMHHPV